MSLKYLICCLFLFSVFFGFSQAQLQLDAGVKAGFNYSRINSGSAVAVSPGYYPGFNAGAYAMLKIDNFAIQSELIYSRQGQTYEYLTFGKYNTQLNYLNIPIVLKAYVFEGLNLQAGAQFGFLMSSKDYVVQTSGNNVNSTTTVHSQSINDYLKAHDTAVILGLGYDFPSGLNINARFNIGASNINYYSGGYLPNNTSTSMGTSKSFNQVFQLSIGYRLFKKELEPSAL